MPEVRRHRCWIRSRRGFFHLPGELRTRREIHLSPIAEKCCKTKVKHSVSRPASDNTIIEGTKLAGGTLNNQCQTGTRTTESRNAYFDVSTH